MYSAVICILLIFLQVMVATVRCEEIANEKCGSFLENEVLFFRILKVFRDTYYVVIE